MSYNEKVEADTMLRIQGQLAAQEFVLKIIVNVMGQLAPNSGMQSAMHQILSNSLRAAAVNAADPADTEELRAYVLQYAQQIIDAGFGARPA
jgi:hypothetical protein